MREVSVKEVTKAVKELFLSANIKLPFDTESALRGAFEREKDGASKEALSTSCENIEVAKKLGMPICQDTGMAVVFAKIGQEVHFTDGSFNDAVNEGVRQAYSEGYFRCSVVSDPVFNRKNTGDNTPAVIHTEIVEGDKITLIAEPKGFGSENMSRIKMFNPSVSPDDIVEFVCETVKSAGGNPCPPVVIGVGIGGTFEKCALLAKEALARPISVKNSDPLYAELEEKMLCRLNETGVGAQGFGGNCTALGVNIEYYPTHIAGLPVAVNVNCHVARHAECEM